jgi:hypothetical protein
MCFMIKRSSTAFLDLIMEQRGNISCVRFGFDKIQANIQCFRYKVIYHLLS